MKKGTTKEQRKKALLEKIYTAPIKGGGYLQDSLVKWMQEEFDIAGGTVLNYLEEMVLDKEIKARRTTKGHVYYLATLGRNPVTWDDLQGTGYAYPWDALRVSSEKKDEKKDHTLDELLEMVKNKTETIKDEAIEQMQSLKLMVRRFLEGYATVAELRDSLEECE
jgi:hypothetical protein